MFRRVPLLVKLLATYEQPTVRLVRAVTYTRMWCVVCVWGVEGLQDFRLLTAVTNDPLIKVFKGVPRLFRMT